MLSTRVGRGVTRLNCRRIKKGREALSKKSKQGCWLFPKHIPSDGRGSPLLTIFSEPHNQRPLRHLNRHNILKLRRQHIAAKLATANTRMRYFLCMNCQKVLYNLIAICDSYASMSDYTFRKGYAKQYLVWLRGSALVRCLG